MSRPQKLVHSIQNFLILHRMVILLFKEEALGNFLPTSLFLSYIGEQNLDEIFPKLLPWIEVSPFDAQLNSESNGLVFMDGTYFLEKVLAESLFRRVSSVVLASHWFRKCVLTSMNDLAKFVGILSEIHQWKIHFIKMNMMMTEDFL